MIEKLLSAGQLFAAFRALQFEHRKRVYSYLDELAEDANALARAWCDILVKIEAEGELDYDEFLFESRFGRHGGEHDVHTTKCAPMRLRTRSLRMIAGSTLPIFSRLEVFYSRLAFIFTEADKELKDSLIGKLSELLHQRNITKADLERQLATGQVDMERVLALVEAISKQAAQIAVFVKEVKARGD